MEWSDERRYSRLYYHRVRDRPVSPKLLRAAHSILWILYHFLPIYSTMPKSDLGLDCGPPKSVEWREYCLNGVRVECKSVRV